MSNSSIIYSIIYSIIRYIVIIFHYYNYKLSYIYKTHALFISIKKKMDFVTFKIFALIRQILILKFRNRSNSFINTK